MRRVITAGLLVFALAFLAFEISINGTYSTDHPTSFVQLDYALWNDHSVALGNIRSMPPGTVDDFTFRGQNYSALAPGTAFLALPFVGLAFTFAGGYTVYGPVLAMSETFVSLAGALSVYLTYKIATYFFRRSTSLLLAFAFGFSTICWPFATYFFQSDVTALFALLAAYFGIRAGRTGGTGLTMSILLGLAAGVMVTTDYVTGILLPVMLAFLVAFKRGSKLSMLKVAAGFLLGALPCLAALGGYNYIIFGSPFVTTEQSYLGQSSMLGGFTTPLYTGLYVNLFSLARGLFAFAPFLVLGVMGYYDALRKKGSRLEMLFLLALFLGVLLPYSAWYEVTGGLSFGPRFLVSAIPFLVLPAGFVVEGAGKKGALAIYALYAWGAVMNGVAAQVTAISPAPSTNYSPFFGYILPRFLAGNLDTFWAGYAGVDWLWGSALVIFLGIVFPVAWVERERRREGTEPLGNWKNEKRSGL